jgi:hypothetical protein
MGAKLAFLSTRDADMFQLFVLDLVCGGEAQQMTHLGYGVAEANWRPDSGALVFISRGDKDNEYRRVEKLRDERSSSDCRLSSTARASCSRNTPSCG